MRFYCRKCRKIVDVYEDYVEKKVFPELKPEFDVVTYCCSICHTPIIEVSRISRQEG